MTSTPPMKPDGDSGSLSGRDAPSDEHSMPDVAAHADLALQDALVTEMDSHGDPVAAYDSAVFLASMRGNGYEITRAGEPRGKEVVNGPLVHANFRIVVAELVEPQDRPPLTRDE